MTEMNIIEDNQFDDHVDDEIIHCLNLDDPKSFFLFAGAGSGKTRTLVKTLNIFRDNNGRKLRLRGQRVAIITYTNAACDEIKRRLDYDPLFAVSTIHSFMWDLINNFQKDIKEWLYLNLKIEIEKLEFEQEKGRLGTKTAINREKSIEGKNKRIQSLESVRRFTYSPNGDNRGRDSLNHVEVLKIGAFFLTEKSLMRKILIRKFPILLIDESQDTNKELMIAFFKVQKEHSDNFSLGLFGDTMQRIYADGKVDLGVDLPNDWEKPAKAMNHRSPKRIIKLINKIRSTVDSQEQRPRTDKKEGIVRLFIFPSRIDKEDAENKVSKRMAEITSDSLWSGIDSDYTALILEHHMAASRLGFSDMFEPLYKVETLKTGLLEGSLPGLKFFTQIILPIVEAKEKEDQFTIARIVRKYSPLINEKEMKNSGDNQLDLLKNVQDAISQLLSLWREDKEPCLIDILQVIAKTRLFDIPGSLYPIAFSNRKDQENIMDEDEEKRNGNKRGEEELCALEECMNSPFSRIKAYNTYVTGQSNFMTHQGVKGLEFPRVMVIIDDDEARGFLFSYEKLFGAKEKTKTDLANEEEGKDSSIDRTRRLFYVSCSRAEESLAIIAYSMNPERVRKSALEEEWFEEGEIELFDQ